MSASSSRRRRGVAATAVGALLLTGGVVATNGEAVWEKVHGGETDSLHEFAKEHRGNLNLHSQALAFVKEKTEKGGEAAGEILNGPAQETYDDNAFPRTTIDPAQTKGSRAAFDNARKRGTATSVQPTGTSGSLASLASLGTWQSVGPTGGYVPGSVTYTGQAANVGGRTTALVFAPGCSPGGACTLYAGTAGGGLWVTTNPFADRPTWTNISDGKIPSTAIGTVVVDQTGAIYVGTGEQNGSSDSESGLGLYVSHDGGQSFQRVPTNEPGAGDFTSGRAVGAVAVDPTNAQHLLVGTEVARHGASAVNGGRFTPPGAAQLGLFESTDGGTTWARVLDQKQDPFTGGATGGDYFKGGVSEVQFVQSGRQVTAFAALNAYGLYRRLPGQAWQKVFSTPFPDTLSSRTAFDTVGLPGGKVRIYIGDSTMYQDSSGSLVSGFLRSDDATAPSFKAITLSSPDKSSPGYGTYNFCQGQCSYDIAVTANPADPNEVVLSGSMNYDEIFFQPSPSNGRAVVRSTDAGVHVTDMTNDAASNGLHPDQHALAIVPNTSGSTEVFFSASDGGVVRQAAPFVDASASCSDPARGLTDAADLANCKAWLSAVPSKNVAINQTFNTLQFQSMSAGPNGLLLGGTQDNGTWSNDLKGGNWFESVGGDGGLSGINPANSKIRFHSYYAPQHDVNFHGSDPTGWDYISDPLLGSGEAASFYTPFVVDQNHAGTVYDGLQHIWRTRDNGGPQRDLDKHCNEFTYDGKITCGDWTPLGGTALNGPGDLSGTYYGSDNAGGGNYVVDITPARDGHTLWSATRRGRVFVSQNIDAKDAQVSFTRIDKAAILPTRFVSSIVVDPSNPLHAWISYSGYSAYAAGGHVYEVTLDSTLKVQSAVDRSYDLGDIPVTALTRTSSGVLLAATDYGVLALDGGHWKVAGSGLPTVLTADLVLGSDGSVYAATHGRGLWKLPVS
ncbi:MAG TPA: hypothetical protein VFS29_03925 [Motilibacteraceae bacterium]|nr:hypothetical protein [Motilibacteraceae bacterium]